MSLISDIIMALGFGCEYSGKCGSYQNNSYCCNHTPLKGDGGSYCGIHRRISNGEVRL